MTATESWVSAQLLNGARNRFELVALPDSPLERDTSYRVLKAMETKRLIESRIENSTASHRMYSLLPLP